MAAPLRGLGHARFHVLDVIGIPMCMRVDRELLYPVDYGAQIGAEFVPDRMRCHRWGCNAAWDSIFEHRVGPAHVTHEPGPGSEGRTSSP